MRKLLLTFAAFAGLALANDTMCLTIHSLDLEGGQWHVKLQNSCAKTTTRIYVRIAFYDKAGYRNGFAWFAVEPLQEKEKAKLSGPVPREGTDYVKLFEMAVDELPVDWFGSSSRAE